MKIVTWNCNGAFRNKFQHISHLEADILIIQECENPESISKKNESYHQFARNTLWCGSNNNKGLGVFASDGIALNKSGTSGKAGGLKKMNRSKRINKMLTT
jgi:exonuclease III